jgi:hypothetical protein
MRPGIFAACFVALTLVAGGCAFVPKTNHRLEEVRGLHDAATRDEALARLAPAELSRAADTFQMANTAWNTQDDSAVVDHLAYLAKQRLAIAREVAIQVAAENAARSARLEHAMLLAAAPGPIRRVSEAHNSR